jgi:type IV pilus assembly protein PilB
VKSAIKTSGYSHQRDSESQGSGNFPEVRPQESLLSLLTPEVAERLCALPLSRRQRGNGFVISFLVSNDSPSDLNETLRFITDSEVELIPADRHRVEQEIFKKYRGSSSILEKSLVGVDLQQSASMQRSYSQKTDELLTRGDGRAAKIIRALIDYCIAHEASDLHIFPERDAAKACVRINGEIYTHDKDLCPAWTLERVVQLFKVVAGLDTTQKFKPQDGSFVYPAMNREITVRISILPTVHGEKVVLRFLGVKNIKSLAELSYGAKALGMIKESLRADDGLIVFSGATGSGKTTALYGAIHELRKQNVTIATIENPVEQILAGISQTSINEVQGLDYVTAFKAILRQDPDVILIGETRDKASAEAVIQASLTGHLILTTVHSRDVFDCIRRLSFLNSDPHLVPDAIRLIVHQKLVPKLCNNCKVTNLLGTNMARKYAVLEIARVFSPGSCAKCSFSGFVGQVPVVEVLKMTPEIVGLIKSNPGWSKEIIKKNLSPDSYISAEDSLIELLVDGVIPHSES